MAVCFFGITRSLSYTLPSIKRNVIEAAGKHGRIRAYGHFFLQHQIDNVRSGERGSFDPFEYHKLDLDQVELEEPGLCLKERRFDYLRTFGDFWQDDFRSLRNLVHQLHSLDRVTKMVLQDEAEVCIFCRPDLRYHDSLAPAILRATKARHSLLQLPFWQPWFGMNDRFAVAAGREAISCYGQRIEQAIDCCRVSSAPLHSESLVLYSLNKADVAVRTIAARASRVRMDGSVVDESFAHPRLARVNRLLGADLTPWLRWTLQ